MGDQAEANCIAWLNARRETHAPFEIESEPIGDDLPNLIDHLYPLCEHGLSLDLCDGPNHYPMDTPYDY